ncbi:DBH-like monooxygenase protein 1 [Hirundo rustica]|nr:DBH-like monooxygenase protein 1 [Hirundo rustica]
MASADIVVGGVERGQPYLQDYVWEQECGMEALLVLTKPQTQYRPYRLWALSPPVQFRSRPAGALLAPGGQGRCDDSPAAAGGAVVRARGARGDGGFVRMGSDGREALLHKPLGLLIPVPQQNSQKQQAGPTGCLSGQTGSAGLECSKSSEQYQRSSRGRTAAARLPAEQGEVSSGSQTPEQMEKSPSFSEDYFTDENRVLKKDPQQDYHLEYAMENSTHTILAFSRELHTCDTNDKSITESTVRVIWAYHHKDMGEAGKNYHGSNRGTKSLRLLNPEREEVSSASLPYFDLTNKDVPVPDKDTTYWCQMFKIPVQHEKHHVTKVEPLIQKGHENLVHHILLYQCSSNLNDSVLDYGHECYHPNMPDSFLTCETVIFAWAIGGEGFTYPPHVGLSIGTAADPLFVLMEVHYDNPSFTEGLIDNSGLRLIYTPVLRKYDAGVIEAGLWVSLFHNIPPGMPEFVSEGHCTLECLEEALGAERPAGIQVFAVLLHAHLAGRAIRMRHFHNGEEQKLLAYDDEFDFNFQEFQYLKEERTILPGDNLVTECHYSTVDRIRMTWGGLSTRNEMCLSYLLYYPRINLTRCASIPDIMEQLQFIGVKEIYRPVRTWPFIIKSPKQYKNLSFMDAMNKFKWSRSEGLSYNQLVLKLPVNVRCSKTDNAEWSIQGMTALPPEIERPYKTEPVICSSSSCLSCSLFLTLLFIVHITAGTIGNTGPFV